MRYLTPLRYPGGKAKLANYIKVLLRQNNLIGGDYVEPYAGGAGVALALLFSEYVTRVHINDIDEAIYAFWHSALNQTAELCRLIDETPVTMESWHQQRAVYTARNADDLLSLGFATFFLNRTNRSGILDGGVIGGQNQDGDWPIDARFNKQGLIARIRKIARYRNRIRLHNRDAVELLQDIAPRLPQRTLIYLDPPYYTKGPGLYQNSYTPEDHAEVARMVEALPRNWVVSYDFVPEIETLYNGFPQIIYDLNYSAAEAATGAEIMVFSNGLEFPEDLNPAHVDIATALGHRQQHLPL